METRFKSLNRDGIAYELLTYSNEIETWNCTKGFLSARIAEYQCFNDGMVQHSPHCLIYGDNIVDCLVSMAFFVNDNKNDNDLMKLVSDVWPTDIYKDKIDFARSIKFNPDKRKFYSITELKTSTSEKMQYDKRYELIPEWADGSIDCLCRMLIPSFSNGLEKFYYYDQLRHLPNMWGNIEGCLIGLTGKTYEYTSVTAENALHILTYFVGAYRLQQQAVRSMECLIHNMESRKAA